jgi:hypothetical protein
MKLQHALVGSFIGGLPSVIAQLNLGVVALLVNFAVTLRISAATRGAAPAEPRERSGRFAREGARIGI